MLVPLLGFAPERPVDMAALALASVFLKALAADAPSKTRSHFFTSFKTSAGVQSQDGYLIRRRVECCHLTVLSLFLRVSNELGMQPQTSTSTSKPGHPQKISLLRNFEG